MIFSQYHTSRRRTELSSRTIGDKTRTHNGEETKKDKDASERGKLHCARTYDDLMKHIAEQCSQIHRAQVLHYPERKSIQARFSARRRGQTYYGTKYSISLERAEI